ncbi:hypothetical protein [Amycolatopsis sp. NPDC052450]
MSGPKASISATSPGSGRTNSVTSAMSPASSSFSTAASSTSSPPMRAV